MTNSSTCILLYNLFVHVSTASAVTVRSTIRRLREQTESWLPVWKHQGLIFSFVFFFNSSVKQEDVLVSDFSQHLIIGMRLGSISAILSFWNGVNSLVMFSCWFCFLCWDLTFIWPLLLLPTTNLLFFFIDNEPD